MTSAMASGYRRSFPYAERHQCGVLPRERYRVDTLRGRTLESAAEILATQGLEQLSLKNIADHARIGIASMYHYFDSKDALLISLALLGFEDLRRDMTRYREIPEYGSPLAAAHQAFLNFAEDRTELLALMFNDRLLAQSDSLRAAERAAFETYSAAVAGDGRFPPVHRTNAARAMWALGRGIAGMAVSFPDAKIPTEMFESLLAGAAYLINHPD